jgi:hypothetical protein
MCPFPSFYRRIPLIRAEIEILSTGFTSFSVLGMALTFALGGLFVVLSYVLEPLLH